MGKIPSGAQKWLYPTPVLLVGANIDGRPNFFTVAWCSLVNREPPMLSIAVQHNRYTYQGIHHNLTFSANIPPTDMAWQVDYCGLTSGSEVNKVEACQFRVFYGKLGNAPLIEQCPINHECAVEHIFDLVTHSLVIGRIVETYISEDCLTDGNPDISKINPIIYMVPPTRQYHAHGRVIGKAFSIGKKKGKNE